MKKAIFSLAFCSIVLATYAQDSDFNRSFRIGISTSLGINQPIRFEKSYVNATFHGKMTSSFNLDFTKFLANKNAIKVGILYSKSFVEVKFIAQGGMPPVSPHTESFKIISIPISYNFYFPKLYYIGIGTILDFEIPDLNEMIITDRQSGFGLTLEAGKELRIKRVTINISPSLQLHSFAPIQTSTAQQRLFVAALNIGINYNLK
jgi:hypothetical protein